MKDNNLPAFVVITGQVHFDKAVSDKEVRVYGYISALSNSKGYCYATNKYLSTTFGVSEKTIQRAVNALVKKGYLKSEIIRDEEGMVQERRLYLTFPTPKLADISNDGMDKNVHRGMDKNVQYNNINSNNNIESLENAQKQTKTKSKSIQVKEDSIYFKVMKHFNSIENSNYKANTKEYMKNIDILLETYTYEDIINVIDYIRDMNFKEEYWRPSTVFRLSNFERNYEFCQKWLKTKKTCSTNTQVSSTTTTYYIINPNTNSITTTPYKPTGIQYYLTKEDAEAAMK